MHLNLFGLGNLSLSPQSFLYLVAICAFAVHTSITTAAQPNFVIIFADDQGYGDLSCFGSKTIKTPNIDRLAEEGRKVHELHGGLAGLHAFSSGIDDGLLP